MINVSNEFKELMKQRQDFKGNAEVTLLSGEVLQLNEEDFSISNNGVVDAADANAVPLGAAICRNIQLELLNDDDHLKEYDFFGAKVRLYLTFQLSNTTEKIEFGTFTVTAPESYGSTVIVTAYDDMYKANAAYQTNLVFPAAAGAVLRDICTSCGIILASTSFLHDDFVIQAKPSSEYTFRQVIGFIAMIACGNARINRGGKLEILSYDLDFSKPHHELTEWISITLDTSDITITGVTTTRKLTADDGTETEEVVEAGKKGYQLTVSNPLAKGSEQTLVSWISERLSGIPFRKFTGDYITYPLAEFMDLAVLTDWRGNVYNTFLTDIDFVFLGITTMKNSAESGLRNQSAYNNEQAGTNVYFKELVEKEKTAREEAVKKLDETLKKGSGLYSTYVKQPDGSTISYFHDKPTVEESKNVIKITSDAIGVSNDGGNTYPYGFVLDGDLITRILYAEGINADYIDAGALTVRDESGKILFMVDMDTKQVVIDGDHLQIGGQPLSEVIMDTKTIILSLDNNYQSVPVDNEGNYDKFPDVTFRPTVHYGFEDITKDCIFTISKSDHVQGSWDNTSKTFKVTGLTADDGWVDIRATYLNRFTDLKRFNLAKLYEGAPGKNGSNYTLKLSSNVVKVGKYGSFEPSSLTISAFYTDGTSAERKPYAGRFEVRFASDGEKWNTWYRSKEDEDTLIVSLYQLLQVDEEELLISDDGTALGQPLVITGLEVILYAAGGLTKVIETESISFVEDVSALTHEEIFDLFTDDGKYKGIYRSGNELYINATYLKSGYIEGIDLISRKGDEWFKISESLATGGYGDILDGLLDLSAQYGDGSRNVVLEARTYNIIFKAPEDKEIVFESGTVIFKKSCEFGEANFTGNCEFQNNVKFNSGIELKDGIWFQGDTGFNGEVKFAKAPQLWNLSHVTDGGHVVLKQDGLTVAYMSSSSKRYKEHAGEVGIEEAMRALDIPVVWFRYKEGYLDARDRFAGKPMPGFYAEDVYRAFPEAARLDMDGKPEDWNYRTLIPLMLRLIQNLYHDRSGYHEKDI